MKQKLYLSIAAFFMLSFYSISQSSLDKHVQPYIGQAEIKKKISELLAVKPVARKRPDLTNLSLLKSRFEKFSDFMKPDKKKKISGVTILQSEEDTKVALRQTSSACSTPTQQVWSNFLSHDLLEAPFWAALPDPSGAVSATQVVVATRFIIKVYDKPAVTDLPVVTPGGYSRDMAHSSFSITLDQFFSPVLPEGSFTDAPHLRYDRLSKCWFVTAIEVNPFKFENNLILIAVSNGDKIRDSSSFTYYSFHSSILPHDTTGFLNPSLGIDKNSVLIGGRQYGNDSITFVGYVINKEKLIKGNLIVYPFALGGIKLATRSITGPLQPLGVHNDDPAAKKSFFIGVNATFDSLIVKNIEYDKRKIPILTSESIIRVPDWNRLTSISAPGGLTPIEIPINTPLLDAAIYKNKLYRQQQFMDGTYYRD
ncbi:MAG: hypothetical protein WKG06_36105 [Segetibacter sp.]